jgi:hypothetical protein
MTKEKSKTKQLSVQRGRNIQKSITQSANNNTPDHSKDNNKHIVKSKDNSLSNRSKMAMQSETPSKVIRTVNKELIEGYIVPIKFKSYMKLPKTQIPSPKDRKHKKINHSRNNLHSNAKSQKMDKPMETRMLEGQLIEDNDMGIDFTTPHFNTEEKSTSKSIFSLLEEYSESPTVFIWSRNTMLLNTEAKDIKFRGELLTIKKDLARFCRHHYVLTLNTLIQYKVLFIVN